MLSGNGFSVKVVYLRQEEWAVVQRLFEVDVELRREVVDDDIGRETVILVPGTAVSIIYPNIKNALWNLSKWH